MRIGVLGSGSGSNCQSIIDAIAAGTLQAEVVCIISDVPDAGILTRAARHGIPAFTLSGMPSRTKLEGDGEQTCIEILHRHHVDVIALAGFMRIVKPGLLDAFSSRILNIHPSLLPSFPGLHAWKQALDYGVSVTGCTVHLVDAGTDTGPIIIQRSVPVLDDDTPETLHARIQVEEHIAYPEALRRIATGSLLIEGRRIRSREDRLSRICVPFPLYANQ